MKVRSVFVSDIHLGTKFCQSEQFLDFLKDLECDYIYLVGDIIDMICLKRGTYWKQQHNTVLQKLLRKARKGTKIIYIAGNHDYFLKDLKTHKLGNIEIQEECIHETADGRKFVVIHGDEFDGILRQMTWCYWFGSMVYNMLSHMDSIAKFFSRFVNRHSDWSLSNHIKHNVKYIITYLSNFEHMIVEKAKKNNADGIICGHIHTASLKQVEGIIYANCGCWTNPGHCTVIVEDYDGKIYLRDVT
jgi:UDP-2,3-diacylglucosamine pyrophosphatase LpxH